MKADLIAEDEWEKLGLEEKDGTYDVGVITDGDASSTEKEGFIFGMCLARRRKERHKVDK